MIAKILLLQIKIAQKTGGGGGLAAVMGGGKAGGMPPPLPLLCRWENLPGLILSSHGTSEGANS